MNCLVGYNDLGVSVIKVLRLCLFVTVLVMSVGSFVTGTDSNEPGAAPDQQPAPSALEMLKKRLNNDQAELVRQTREAEQERADLREAWTLVQEVSEAEQRAFWRAQQQELKKLPLIPGQERIYEWVACLIHGKPRWAPEWADAGGEDRYGRWVTLTLPGGWVQGFRQRTMVGWRQDDQPVWIAETEMPQGAWEALMEQRNPSRFQGDEFPVESVTYLQACDALDRLNKHFRDMDSRDIAVLPLGGPLYEVSLAEVQRNAELAGASLPARTKRVWALPDVQDGLFGFHTNVAEWQDSLTCVDGTSVLQAAYAGWDWLHQTESGRGQLGCDAVGAREPTRGLRLVILTAPHKEDLQWFRSQRMPPR
jgi:hypothetical protein